MAPIELAYGEGVEEGNEGADPPCEGDGVQEVGVAVGIWKYLPAQGHEYGWQENYLPGSRSTDQVHVLGLRDWYGP